MFDDLSAPVGRGRPNNSSDVSKVRDGLNVWLRSKSEGGTLFTRSDFDDRMEEAIRLFQRTVIRDHIANGVVEPGGKTAQLLCELGTAGSSHTARGGVPLHLPPRSGYDDLTPEQYQAVADRLGCEVKVIMALGLQEGRTTGGFDRQNRPTILFEPKIFNDATAGSYRGFYPDLTIKPSTYGTDSRQWALLEAAYYLDSAAALKATSWGLFQVLGISFREAGYASPELMVNSMCASYQKQLDAFSSFCANIAGLSKALHDKNWAGIARAYNGKGYQKKRYDLQLKEKYDSFF